jgi:hypothetical protein
MTHALDLPALDGRDPLGFLATLGLLRLLTQHTDVDARLSFSPVTAHAILHGPYTSCDQVVDDLSAILDRMPAGSAIPGLPTGYPLAKTGTKGTDPMRVPREDYPRLTAQARAAGGDAALAWQSAIVTDLARDNKGQVALTPYCAPSGQQTVRSFFEKPLTQVRAQPAHLREALLGWRRVPGFTGEYLDHRVLRSAADHPRGESSEVGVPGATWLATMALPLLRLTGDGTTTTATLWRRPPNRPPVMVWPIWRQPLDLAAITTLIEHPAITVTIDNGTLQTRSTCWPPLGVFAVGAAQRRQIEGRKNAGVLTPVHVAVLDQ